MEKLILLENKNMEELGKFYFKKAVDFALNKEFGKSYEFFKEGLDFLTCDCSSGENGGWLGKYTSSEKTLFNDIENANSNHIEYYFVKALFLSYEDEKKELYFALDAIDKYIQKSKDEYGYYIKGKIHTALGEPNIALDNFLLASKINYTNRLKYRIGRIKEERLEQYGIDLLHESFIANTSASCCLRVLKKQAQKYALKYKVTDGLLKNFIYNSYINEKDEWRFEAYYIIKYLSNNKSKDLKENNLQTINEFISFLKVNSTLFEKKDNFKDIENHKGNHYKDKDEDNVHEDYFHDNDEPYMSGDPRYDRDENPWIDVFGEGDEAETAYWNTH